MAHDAVDHLGAGVRRHPGLEATGDGPDLGVVRAIGGAGAQQPDRVVAADDVVDLGEQAAPIRFHEERSPTSPVRRT